MRCQVKLILCALIILLPVPARAEVAGVFDGIYFGLKLGFLAPHLADDRFESLEDLEGSRIKIEHKADNGFGINLSFGGRLDARGLGWARSELEFGWQRYVIDGIREDDGDDLGNSGNSTGTSRAFSLIWNNYFHPLDKQMPHQIWVGGGFGGSFAETKLLNASGVASRGGVNFVALASIGYDYRILERSRFSTEYLLLGISYRFMFADGFRREIQSQIMVGVSYGF